LIGLIAVNFLHAQILGYGSGVSHQVQQGEIYYTDEYRLRMDNPGASGNAPAPTGVSSAEFRFVTPPSSALIPPVGTQVVIYAWRPDNANCGRFAGGEVLSVNPTSRWINIEFYSSSLMSDALGLYNTGSQEGFLVSTMRYSAITLEDGGTITCHPHDSNGGGLCVIVTDDLIIEGGAIDVTGKGYIEGCISSGINLKGIGGSADPTYSGGGGNGGTQNNSNLCMIPAWSGCKGIDGTDGDNAGSAGTSGSSYSGGQLAACSTNYTMLPTTPNYNNGVRSIITMGTSNVSTSVTASDGGQGGGFGGNGGDACNTINV
jgi:hypothetical protein